nr:uncharacterized protein LOC112986549 [Dromaius novaehollandiae]
MWGLRSQPTVSWARSALPILTPLGLSPLSVRLDAKQVQVCAAEPSKGIMAAFLSTLQLLFLGTLIVPAYLQTERCNLLSSATAGNFSVSVVPDTYEANTTYAVEVSDSRNLTDSKSVTAVLLQALSSQNVSVGEWKDTDLENCSSITTAVVNAMNVTVNWTSPSSSISSVEIRVYTLFSDNSTEFNSVTLSEKAVNTTTASTITTPNSISAVQSSTIFVAIVQAVLLFVTSKLLS